MYFFSKLKLKNKNHWLLLKCFIELLHTAKPSLLIVFASKVLFEHTVAHLLNYKEQLQHRLYGLWNLTCLFTWPFTEFAELCFKMSVIHPGNCYNLVNTRWHLGLEDGQDPEELTTPRVPFWMFWKCVSGMVVDVSWN